MKILILPGLDGTGLMLSDFVAELEHQHTVQLIDYPTQEQLTYSKLADFVSQKLPSSEPYILIAESFSGPIAAKISSQKPQNLRAIIFVASFVKTPVYLPKSSGVVAKFLPLKSTLLLKLASPFTFGRWRSNEFDKLLNEAIKTVSSKVLALRIKELMRADELKLLKEIAVTLLYIRPSNDSLVSRRSLQAMRQANPKIEIKKVLGPHFILQVKPRECAISVREFLNNLTSS